MKFAASVLAGWILCAGAFAQPHASTLRDLESLSPRTLSKDEVTQLVSGAHMSRLSMSGNTHSWVNDSSGSFIVTSENMGTGAGWRGQGRPTTALGKWHIADDGRYCVLIAWSGMPTEEWCRFVLATNDGYYTVRADNVGTERVFRFAIKQP
jgi:hypothetical protein